MFRRTQSKTALLCGFVMVAFLFIGCGGGDGHVVFVFNFTSNPATFIFDGTSHELGPNDSSLTLSDVDSGSHTWEVIYTVSGEQRRESGTIDIQANMSASISFFGVEFTQAPTHDVI